MNFNLNIADDDYNLNDYLMVFEKFGQRPNKLILHDTFSGNSFESILNGVESNIITELLPTLDGYIINEKRISKFSDSIWYSYVSIDKSSNNFIINELTFYYKSELDKEIIEKIINDLSESIIDYDTESTNKFNTITISNNGIELDPINIDTSSLKIEGRYKSETIKQINKLSDKIKNTNKGITIICGEKGVGKTTISKFLCSKIDRMVVYIPNNMVDITINNPEFRGFFKKFEKIFIVIDDCEFLSNNQFSKIDHFSNNIIQLTDGFLSESLNIQILLIFNINKDEIDDALVHSNSLIEIIEIGNLSTNIANDLSKKIGYNKKYKQETKLVDVLNDKKISKQKIGL